MPVVGLQIEYLMNNVATDETVVERMVTAFERAGTELKDFPKHLWPKMPAVFETEMRKQFAEEGGGPKRGHWEALSPEYAKWKSQAFPGQPILQASGTMYLALTDSAFPFAERQSTNTFFEFGTKGLPYPSFHQLGTRFMPDRPPYDFSEDFQRDLLGAARQAAHEAIKEARLDEFVTESP